MAHGPGVSAGCGLVCGVGSSTCVWAFELFLQQQVAITSMNSMRARQLPELCNLRPWHANPQVGGELAGMVLQHARVPLPTGLSRLRMELGSEPAFRRESVATEETYRGGDVRVQGVVTAHPDLLNALLEAAGNVSCVWRLRERLLASAVSFGSSTSASPAACCAPSAYSDGG